MQTRLRKLALPMLALCLWAAACVVLVTHAVAQAPVPVQTSTGFYWPTGKEVKQDSWLMHACTNAKDYKLGNAGYIFTNRYHTGEDIGAEFKSPVYAISDGEVDLVNDSPSWGKDNRAVIVKHTLDDNSTFLAIYGHIRPINPNLKKGDLVTAGIPFATIGKWPYGDHLHFGIARVIYDMSMLGTMPCSALKPNDTHEVPTNGYTAPITWITTHKPKNRDSSAIRTEPAPISLPVPVPLPVGIPLPAQAIVIDVASSHFLRAGDAAYWFTAAGGYNNGSFWWTNNEPITANNIVTWELPTAQPGSYEVLAYIPATHASTMNAVYEIRHAGGIAKVSIKQREYPGQWVSLGTFEFAGNGGEYVRLSDVTGEPKLTRQVGFDAICITPANALITGDPLSWLSERLDELKKNSGKWLKDLELLPKKFEAWINSLKDNAQKEVDQWLQKQLETLLQELLRQIEDSLKQMCVGNVAIVVVLPALSLWLSRRRK